MGKEGRRERANTAQLPIRAAVFAYVSSQRLIFDKLGSAGDRFGDSVNLALVSGHNKLVTQNSPDLSPKFRGLVINRSSPGR